MTRTLSFAYGPNADDAFLFYALATGRVTSDTVRLEPESRDIESLNLRVVNGEADVSAVSAHAYARAAGEYVLLPHGLTMSEGAGPCLVAGRPMAARQVRGRIVAVPGQLTSAHLVLRLFERDVDVRFIRSDDVIGYVVDGFADAGVVAHEDQLLYADAGLHLVLDLGAWWQEKTGLPLPLGGVAARRSLGDDVLAEVCRLVEASVRYALAHGDEAVAYAAGLAPDLPRAAVEEYIGRCVRAGALDADATARRSLEEFLGRGYRAGLIDRLPPVDLFAC
jgi:1,4-dihydroxy-6-naphthoate synthase